MSNRDQLNYLTALVQKAQAELETTTGMRDSILKPMFDEQEALAIEILIEPEFADIRTKFAYHSPHHSLISEQYGNEFHVEGDKFYTTSEYYDCERAPEVYLLPEFVDGTTEDKKEAIRNYYRKFLKEKLKEQGSKKEQEIEKAKAVLRANGFIF